METVDNSPKGVKYKEYMESDVWREKRRIMLDRAGHKCQLCGTTKSLGVHHNTYKNLGDEPLEDLCVLCWPCHSAHHERRRLHKQRKRAARSRRRAARRAEKHSNRHQILELIKSQKHLPWHV